ncbi:hypothetical protein, partial [Bacteroides acidifaciens]|uniref:hypothetical protein n=1 Tax=Bacteroides acidifaciens TaxID=85831 RepID=UPI0025A65748
MSCLNNVTVEKPEVESMANRPMCQKEVAGVSPTFSSGDMWKIFCMGVGVRLSHLNTLMLPTILPSLSRTM